VTFVDAVILVAIPALIIEGVVVGAPARSGGIATAINTTRLQVPTNFRVIRVLLCSFFLSGDEASEQYNLPFSDLRIGY
jgi:hypothetical protein